VATLFSKKKTAKNTATMARVLPDAVINTSRFFTDIHENISHLMRQGIQDIFTYRESVCSTEKFFGNNLKLIADLRESTKLQDINATVADRECRTSPQGIIIVRSSVLCTSFKCIYHTNIFAKSFSKNTLTFLFINSFKYRFCSS
jgi:hypothetical protein